jgi:hypothetical protein
MTPYDFQQTLIGNFVANHQFTDASGRAITDVAMKTHIAAAAVEQHVLPELRRGEFFGAKIVREGEAPSDWETLGVLAYQHLFKGIPKGKRTPSVLAALLMIAAVHAQQHARQALQRALVSVLESDPEVRPNLRREMGLAQ